MEKRTLFLQPDCIKSYRQDHGAILHEHTWPVVDGLPGELPAALLTYLDENAGAEFNLLLELPEEECHQEGLKATSRQDRRHLVQRIRQKRFDNALLSAASVHSKGGDAVLRLSGVMKHQHCSHLLDQIRQRNISLREIHSPITLMSALMKLISERAQSTGGGANQGVPGLIVLPFQGGYRVLACIDNSVCFNRRITLNNQGVLATELDACLAETLNYLQRQQLPGWQAPELVIVGVPKVAAAFSALDKSVLKSGLIREITSFCCSPGSEATVSIATATCNQTDAEKILTKAAFHCGGGYADQKYRKTYIERKVRHVCLALALCGAAGAVSSTAVANKISSTHLTVTNSYHQSSSAMTDLIAKYELQHAQPVEAVRQALVTASLIKARADYDPVEFLHEVSRGIKQQPDVSISSIHWELDDVFGMDTLSDTYRSNADPKELPMDFIYHATVSGSVSGRPQGALEAFESFVANLRRVKSNPAVVVVETPFGLDGAGRADGSVFSEAQGQFLIELSNDGVAR